MTRASSGRLTKTRMPGSIAHKRRAVMQFSRFEVASSKAALLLPPPPPPLLVISPIIFSLFLLPYVYTTHLVNRYVEAESKGTIADNDETHTKG